MPNQKKRLSVGMQTRYNQVDEIQFAVNSVLKYANFIRHIFIVTDNQIPDFLNKENTKYTKVKIVDHKVIFKGFESFLPTFSSRSIETLIYRIPELSEHFLYCNDDFFFINKVNRQDFFKDDKVIIRGRWLILDEYNPLKKIARKLKAKKGGGHKLAQQKAASILGFKRYFKFHHTPQAFRKSTIETFFKENSILLKKNISYRFRDKEQYIVQSLANHLEIQKETAILKSTKELIYFQNYKKPLWYILKKINSSSDNKLFLCLQSLDQCPKEKLSYIINWLENRTRK